MKANTFPAIIAVFALVCCSPLLRADEAAQRATAAEELLKAMHMGEVLKSLLAQRREAITKKIPSFLPKDSSPETVQLFQQTTPKIMDIVDKHYSWESLRPDFIQIYSEVFTEQEIKDLTVFYKSPIGQKLYEETPVITAKIIQILQKQEPAIKEEELKVFKEITEQAKTAAKASASPAAK